MKFRKQNIRLSSNLINIIKGIVVGSLLLALIYVNMTRPRVLVLHSYAEDFAWVANFNTAFKNTFGHADNPVVYYSYMNTLNKQSARYKYRAGQEEMQLINTIRPDIILAIFTDASEFAVKNYINHPKIQIIYNLKSDPSQLGYDTAKNAQGIKTGPALEALNNLLLLATPKRPIRIGHIGDQSYGVRLYDTYLTTYAWKNVVLVDSILISNFPQWKDTVKALSDQADYLVISKYHNLTETADTNSKIIPTKEVMKWTMENSKIPVIGLYTDVVDEGGDIAIEDSPFEQGQMMAEMAIQLLNKKPVIPKMQGTQHFIVVQNNTPRPTLPEVYSSFSMALKQVKKLS